MSRLTLLTTTLLALTSVGCLEREEQIEVRADGSLDVIHTITGDAADLDDGKAALPGDDIFVVTRETVSGDKGDAVRLVATARFDSAAGVPDRFSDQAGALRMTTRLEREEQDDGSVRFALMRTYHARDWAALRHSSRQGFSQQLGRLFRGDADDGERAELVDLLIAAERGKTELMAHEALEATYPDADALPTAQLAVRAEIARFFREQVTAERVHRILEAPVDERQGAVRALQRKLDGSVIEAAAEALSIDEDDRNHLRLALAEQRTRHEVTGDLDDETFVVRVRLPGDLHAHNGVEVEPGVVEWRFKGDALHDRDHTLLASSTLKSAPN